MKLGEALQERNDLQQTLSRLQRQRAKLFQVGNKDTDFDYDELSSNIMKTHIEINTLKLSILKTNLETAVTVELENLTVNISLQEAILKVTTLKSELSEYSQFESNDNEYLFRRRGKDENSIIKPLTDSELSKHIKKLEKEKRVYNHAIQGTNWKVSLSK